MSAPANCQLIGRWRIIKADLWDRDLTLSIPPLSPSERKTTVRSCLKSRYLTPHSMVLIHLAQLPMPPKAWLDAGLRRFGFHGTSHKYVAIRAAEEIGVPLCDLQIVSVHLGNGASVCAINRGESIDTSMGMTTLEGLVMGTRSGDVHLDLFGFLSRQHGLSIMEVEEALYSESALKGLTGSSDIRDVEDRGGGWRCRRCPGMRLNRPSSQQRLPGIESSLREDDTGKPFFAGII